MLVPEEGEIFVSVNDYIPGVKDSVWCIVGTHILGKERMKEV